MYYKHISTIVGMVFVLVSFSGCSEQYVDRLIDRTTQSAERKVQQRIDRRVDQGIDKAINETEESVVCVATDPDCLQQAKDAGKKVVITGSEESLHTMKCAATDTRLLE